MASLIRIPKKLAKLTGYAIIAVIVLAVVSHRFFHRGETGFHRYAEIRSTGGSYTAIIDVGYPSTPYGPHKIDRVIIDRSNQAIIHERYDLSNGGAVIDYDNIQARWVRPDYFEICLRGDEQRDVLVSVRVASKEVTKETMEC